MKNKWLYSESEDYWVVIEALDTKEEAIAHGRVELEGRPFFVGQAREPKLTVSGEGVLDSLYGWNEEEFCEASEGLWPPDLTLQQETDLSDLLTTTLKNWLIVNKKSPSWFLMENVEMVEETPANEATK